MACVAPRVLDTSPRQNLAVWFSRLPPAHPSSLIVNTCTWSRSRHDPPASRGFGQSGCRRDLGSEIPVGLFVEDVRADLTPLGARIVLGQVVLALISSAADMVVISADVLRDNRPQPLVLRLELATVGMVLELSDGKWPRQSCRRGRRPRSRSPLDVAGALSKFFAPLDA